jgi:hypothetical protein
MNKGGVMMNRVTRLFCLLALLTALPPVHHVLAVNRAEQMDTKAVWGDYTNTLTVGVDVPETSAPLHLFNGHVGPYAVPGSGLEPAIPAGGDYRLEESAFGQPVARDIPYSGFEEDADRTARKMLYWEAGDASDRFDRNKAAFRYKDLLYGMEGGDSVSKIRARFENMVDYYGDAESSRTLEAEKIIRDALKYNPWHAQLRSDLLDIFYDRATAEQILAREALVKCYQQRLEPVAPGKFVIEGEIEAFESLFPNYRKALLPYFELIKDPMGVAADVYSNTPETAPPFGYALLQSEEPQRSQYEATFQKVNNEGTTVSCPVLDDDGNGQVDNRAPKVLYAGYKDLVLVFNLEQDLSKAAVELARLYVKRGSNGDREKALKLINELQSSTYVEGNVMLGAFPEFVPSSDDTTGFSAALAGWRVGVTELTSTQQFINGKANLLGFDEDFLMLVQSFSQTGNEFFDSYDAIYEWMTKDDNAPLNWADISWQYARENYDNYRGYCDELATQFSDKNETYNSRLFEICGKRRGEIGYDTPERNDGCEINLQIQSIDLAQNKIEQNKQEITNLKKQIEYEVERRGQEKGINNAIGSIYIEYGDKQSDLTMEIGAISAAQALANAAAEAASSFGDLNIAGGVAHSINAALQAGAEIGKACLQGDKEQLQAEENMKIKAKDDELLDVNSQANIKTWLLQMSSLSLQSSEAVMLLRQEFSRLAALYNERDEIEREMDECNDLLSERYFADPIHRLRMQDTVLDAQYAFEESQKWVFYAAKALEYKWNEPFIQPYENINWSTASIFKLRNATELSAMVRAMQAFDGLHSTAGKDDYYDWFSFRDDFLGYKYANGGTVLYYTDPVTGESNLDGKEMLHRYLRRLVEAAGYQSSDRNIYLTLSFSTIRQIPAGFFFQGPQYDDYGNLMAPGMYNDKIDWIKINLPGSHTTGKETINGQLSYGGVSMIRNQDMGIVNPEDPSRVSGEMTAYSTRYWYWHGASGSWRFTDAMTKPAQMQLSSSNESKVPPDSVSQINGFKERSVAASEWKLVIPLKVDNVTVLKINELDDIEFYVYHWAYARQ